MIRRRAAGIAALLLAAGAGLASGQQADGVAFGAHAIGMLSRVEPIRAGAALTEWYLTQPVLFAHARVLDGRAELHGMLNLEGLSLQRGELAPGAWGEGYIDRRHPHTYLHEMMASGLIVDGRVRASLSAGRGFAPFGTDDPMGRPIVRFPSNHHLSQILERWVGVLAVGAGPVTVEGALFNGDEPDGPDDFGMLERFGDSWALRVTARPAAGVEVQGSRAWIESPEVRSGGGADQEKWSASARYQAEIRGLNVYGLAEWSQTADSDRGTWLYGFRSWLAETAVERGGWTLAARYEDATRPEEDRLRNPFRSPRPHVDFHLLGVTRWRTLTGHVAREMEFAPMRATPFVELGRANTINTTRSFFDPVDFYGSNTIWSASLGLRLGAGTTHDRMGRYGIARADAEHEHGH